MSKRPKVMASVAFLSPLLGWRAERRYRRLESLLPASVQGLPSLSIIVPARNEAANLECLLPSLCQLDFAGEQEVIVVDDGSTDQTATIARRFGVRVISLEKLPSDWYGKPYACHVGAGAANGDWLLFTDADTIHAATGPARAVSYAREQGLDGLSAFLKQEHRGLLDELVLQVAFAGLFANLPDRHTMLNGQYILLRREVYVNSGGFASVKDDPLEDLALGHHLHRLGYRVPLLSGDSLGQVAMYRNRTQLWHGMARIGSGTLRWSGINGLVTALFITSLMTPLLVMAMSVTQRLDRRWVLISWGAAVAGFWPWSRRFGSRRQLLLVPAGALFVQSAAMWGLISRFIGRGVHWKGRAV